MPSIETDELNQKAILWEAVGRDRFNEVKVSSPVEVDVRWIWKRRESGDSQPTDADAIVDREISIGSTMWLGTLVEWVGTGSEGDDSDVMEVTSYVETPDLKGREIRREIRLAFYKGNQPELAG